VTHIITSDTHLGCRYLDTDLFMDFLAALPPDAELVLAGDVVDRSHRKLTGGHQAAFNQLVALSERQHVVWVRGNHDRHFDFRGIGHIEWVEEYAIGKRLLIAHGHHFDNIMPYHRWFIHLIRTIHALRILLGADAIHVARYAKRFPTLYGVLCNHVARNAVQHAREHGYAGVICGHTHHAETRDVEGIRYINTGAWTEDTPHYVEVTGEDIRFMSVRRQVSGSVPR
jgi:UDP-2,3-diacylglucosamine pyrophosphatase LpxH